MLSDCQFTKCGTYKYVLITHLVQLFSQQILIEKILTQAVLNSGNRAMYETGEFPVLLEFINITLK